MAKSPTFVYRVSVNNKNEIAYAAKEERCDEAVIGREAMSEWMEKRGYQWTDDFKPNKRPLGRFPSFAAQARVMGLSRQAVQQRLNKKNKENK